MQIKCLCLSYSSSKYNINIGRTALDEALSLGNHDVAKLLIKHGATEFRDENGKKELF